MTIAVCHIYTICFTASQATIRKLCQFENRNQNICWTCTANVKPSFYNKKFDTDLWTYKQFLQVKIIKIFKMVVLQVWRQKMSYTFNENNDLPVKNKKNTRY